MMKRLRRHTSVACTAWVLAWTSPVDAQEAKAMAWIAPNGCPQQADIIRRIESIVNRPSDAWPANPRAVARVTQTTDGWSLTLELRDASGVSTSRHFTAMSCAELADAAAVAVALTLAPDRVAHSEEQMAMGPREAAGSTAALPDVQPEAPPEDALEVVPVRWSPASAPSAELDSARSARFGEQSMVGFSSGPLGTVSFAALGGPTVGVGGTVAMDFGSRWRAEARGTMFSSRTVALEDVGSMELSLWTLGANGCAVAQGQITGVLCGGVEVGRLRGVGADVQQPGAGTGRWLSPILGAGALVTWDVLELAARVETAFPLYHERFVVENGDTDETLLTIGAVDPRLSFAAAVRFQ